MSIELTEAQRLALANEPTPYHIVNPATRETYVLIPADFYERLLTLYDDSPWTDEEKQSLAWEAGQGIGWDDTSEYDEYDKHRP
jgi:hypothetical protein